MPRSALETACQKLKQQEVNRLIRKRKECEAFIRQQQRFRDKRKNKKSEPLAKWEYYLRLRRKITKKITKRTGKTPAQMLLNCSGSTEKAMIQRLLYQAEKLSPENQWRHERLLTSRTRCGLVYKVPAEEAMRRSFAIYGLPDICRTESQSTCCLQNWFKSKLIAQKLEEKKLDIYNLITHFPDVDGLQVLGTSMKLYPPDESEQGQGDQDSPLRRSTKSPPKMRLSQKF